MQANQEQPADVKHVIKRNGARQPLNLEKIRARFVNKGAGLNQKFINFDVIVQKVAEGIYQGKLSPFSAELSRQLISTLFFG